MSGRVYRALLPVARGVARVFHRTLSVRFAERMPGTGPVILAANHPNMMLDVLALAVSQPRELHFLAKATLFENPLSSSFLRSAGVLPVYRRRDDPGQTGRNVLTFEACHELLAAGGALAIFPEGESHERNVVLPLKTGCARICLEAEARNGFELGARIVPVGLAFSNRELFRSDAVVAFGEPIDPREYFGAYREGRESAAVRGLTAELEASLKRLAPHIPDASDEVLVAALRDFFRDADAPLAPHLGPDLDLDRTLLDAVEHFRERSPLAYARLRRSVLRYRRALSLAGLTHEELGRTYRFFGVLRYLLPRLVLAAAGLVPFIAGTATHYLPYKLPAWAARRFASPVERATTKLFTGLIAFPAFYALVTLLVATRWGWTAALIVLACLPLLGLFTLFYSEALSGFARDVGVFVLRLGARGRLSRLGAWREELTRELSERRREYEAHLALENSPPG